MKHNFSFFWWVRYLLPNTCLWFGCIKVFLFFSQLENYTPSLPLVPLVFVCREWWWAVRECGLWRRCWNTTPVHWRQACSPITAHALRLNHKQQLTYRRHSQKPRPKHFSIPTLYLTLECLPAEQLRYCKVPTETTIILISEEIHTHIQACTLHTAHHIIHTRMHVKALKYLISTYVLLLFVIFQDVFDDANCTHSFSFLFFWLTSMVLKNNYFKRQLFVHNLRLLDAVPPRVRSNFKTTSSKSCSLKCFSMMDQKSYLVENYGPWVKIYRLD